MEELSRKYREPLKRFFQSRLGAASISEADDLVQELFLRLVNTKGVNLHRPIQPYLFQAAANLLRDRHRRLNVRNASAHETYDESIHATAAPCAAPDQAVYNSQLIARLIAALHDIPERSRTVFVLYHFHSLRHAEIARQLTIAVSTVEKHIARVNAHLLKHIGHLP